MPGACESEFIQVVAQHALEADGRSQTGCEDLRRAPELEHAGAGVGRGRSGFLAARARAEAKALNRATVNPLAR